MNVDKYIGNWKHRPLFVLVTVSLLSGCGKISIDSDTVGVYLDESGNISSYEAAPGSVVDVGLKAPAVSKYIVTPIQIDVGLQSPTKTSLFIPEATLSFEYRIDPNLAADFRIEYGFKASTASVRRRITVLPGEGLGVFPLFSKDATTPVECNGTDTQLLEKIRVRMVESRCLSGVKYNVLHSSGERYVLPSFKLCVENSTGQF